MFAQTRGRLVDLSDFNGSTRRHFYDADALADDIYGAAILIVLHDYFFLLWRHLDSIGNVFMNYEDIADINLTHLKLGYIQILYRFSVLLIF